MNSTLKIIIALSFFCIIITSCVTPEPIIELRPKANNTKWNSGLEFSIYEEDGIKVAVAYYTNTDEYLIFNVMIENKSNRTIMVDPSNFMFKSNSEDDNTIDYKNYAIDPEGKLFELKRKSNIQIADSKNAKIADIVLEVTDAAVTTAAAIEDDNDADIHINNFLNRSYSRSIDREIREDNFQFNMENLEDARYIWENKTIRKTHLEPGFYIDGQVYFKRIDDLNEIQFVLPLGNELVKFNYEQIIYWL